MKKTIEIEIPDGKVEKISKEGDTISIKFVDVFECVKSLDDAINIAKELYPELYNKWYYTTYDSYEEKLYEYHIIVAVLTNNEKNHLTTGDCYYPFVQFCHPDKVKNCAGDTIIGHIKSEGEKFAIVGGSAYGRNQDGIGCFCQYDNVSASQVNMGFLSVSSRKIAEHISKYFGRLVFDLIYGESNCEYKWID